MLKRLGFIFDFKKRINSRAGHPFPPPLARCCWLGHPSSFPSGSFSIPVLCSYCSTFPLPPLSSLPLLAPPRRRSILRHHHFLVGFLGRRVRLWLPALGLVDNGRGGSVGIEKKRKRERKRRERVERKSDAFFYFSFFLFLISRPAACPPPLLRIPLSLSPSCSPVPLCHPRLDPIIH